MTLGESPPAERGGATKGLFVKHRRASGKRRSVNGAPATREEETRKGARSRLYRGVVFGDSDRVSERADESVLGPNPSAATYDEVGLAPAPAGFDAALPGPAAALEGLGTRFEGVDRQVAARMVLELGRGHGNAAVARALDPRHRVESLTGYDLSQATVHESSPRAAAAGVEGLAHGTAVHLAPGVSAGTAHGDHVIAHELAHVVQQGTGRAAGIDSHGRREVLEADAESVATRAGSAGPARGVLAPLPPAA